MEFGICYVRSKVLAQWSLEIPTINLLPKPANPAELGTTNDKPSPFAFVSRNISYRKENRCCGNNAAPNRSKEKLL